MPGQFENKVALVTGGSSGIGRATSLAFAREGAKVVVASYTNVEGGEATVQMIAEQGGEAVLVRTDVSKPGDVERLVNQATKTFGQLDCAVNNAGILGELSPTAECTEENWDRVTSIHLKGVWLCMKYEIRRMLKQGYGAIVNTSSIGGLVGLRSAPAYVASKHGIIGLAKAAALEYAEAGIRVNVVCPAFTRTPLLDRIVAGPEEEKRVAMRHPMNRLGTPEEVASAAVWLCSDAASFITGHALPVDGGYVAQ